MDEKDFEGSLLLEQLASMGLIDDFFEAVDSDNIQKIISLLRDAEIDEEAISMVLKSM